MRTAAMLLAAAMLAPAAALADGPPPSLGATYQAAIGRCASEADHAACWQRTKAEYAELQALLATEAKYTPAWAEQASPAELAGAHAEYIAAVAHTLPILRRWGVPVPPVTAAITEALDALVAGEQACRATPKCMAAREAAKADAVFFEATVQPMCQADQDRESAIAGQVHERANPSGVVSLSRLHELGAEQQAAQARIAALGPEYAAHRHHGWAGWRTECH